MLVRILQGKAVGVIEDHDEVTGQSLIDTGFGEAVTMVEGVPEVVPVPEPDEEGAEPEVMEVVAEEADGGDDEGPYYEEVVEPEAEEEATVSLEEYTMAELEDLTMVELEDLGDTLGVQPSDIEGTGARGGILKGDWTKALSAKLDEEAEADEG